MVSVIRVDIVGGSISGFSAAMSLKECKKSIEVVVHEKYREIGYNHEGRQCGEAHTVEGEWKKWAPENDSIFNDITKGEVLVGNKKLLFQRTPGTSCILNRQAFICQLARTAKQQGVVIQTNDKIKTIAELEGDYIIDASGCPSSIKRELGIPYGLVGSAYQQTLEQSNWFFPNTVKIVFFGEFGYYWIFPRDPRKKEINLGVGVFGDVDCTLKAMLEAFKEEQGIEGKINYVTGGLVPAGLQRPLLHDNILFVGDAGVGTFPLTGQGIYRALLSGDVAGKCIAQQKPQQYPYVMDQKFIKWDVLGKTFLHVNNVMRRVGPQAVLTSLKHFFSLFGYIQ